MSAMRWVAAALVALTFIPELPAVAAPLHIESMTSSPGNVGVCIPFSYVGKLGNSGLAVETTPTMVLIRAVAAGSPAALVEMPAPGATRIRLAAINGRPIEGYKLADFLAAFGPGRAQVSLTVARKRASDLVETLAGPYDVPLSDLRLTEVRTTLAIGRSRFGAPLASDAPLPAERLLLVATDSLAAGDYRGALAILGRFPAGHPQAPEADRLRTRGQDALASELLAEADNLATQGFYPAALKQLKALSDDGSVGALKRLREADWTRAMSLRSAIRQDETARKARERAEAEERQEARRRANAAAEAEAAERRAKRRARRRRGP